MCVRFPVSSGARTVQCTSPLPGHVKIQRIYYEYANNHGAVTPRPFYTVTAAANALGVSRGMVARYLAEGTLDDSPVGTAHRIPAASLADLIIRRHLAGEESVRLVRDEPNNPRVLAARESAQQAIAARDS